jgi:hypothetical protein
MKMEIGGKYNWINQPERLVYLGRKYDPTGFWHQFAKVESPTVVWCEVQDSQLEQFEETKPEPESTAPTPIPYPEGIVVGPCVCGSWPGGECLKCERINPCTS